MARRFYLSVLLKISFLGGVASASWEEQQKTISLHPYRCRYTWCERRGYRTRLGLATRSPSRCDGGDTRVYSEQMNQTGHPPQYCSRQKGHLAPITGVDEGEGLPQRGVCFWHAQEYR